MLNDQSNMDLSDLTPLSELTMLRARQAELEGALAEVQQTCHKRKEFFSRLARRVAATTTLEGVVEIVRDETDLLFGWDAHFFAIREPGEGRFRLLSIMDTIDGERRKLDSQPEITVSPAWETVLEGEALLISRAEGESDPELVPFGDVSRKSLSIMNVPVRTGNVVHSVLSVQSYTANRYSQDDLADLQFIADITAPVLVRTYAETALRQSEQRYCQLYNKTPVMLHSVDCDGRLLSVSDYWLVEMGYTREEVIGRKATDFFTPESASYFREVMQPVYKRTGTCKEVPYRLITKKGNTLDVLMSANAEFDDAGKVERSVVVMVDVTRRKRVEELVAAENEILEVVVGGADLSVMLAKLVQMVEELSGETSAAIQILDERDQTLAQGCAPHLPEAFMASLNGLKVEANSGASTAAALQRRLVVTEDIDTDPLWEKLREVAQRHGIRSCWATPILSTKGVVLGTLLLFGHKPASPTSNDLRLMQIATHLAGIALGRSRDEATERRLRSQIQHAQKLESLGVLAGGIAHDFNNLLAGILGNTGLAMLDLSPESPALPVLRQIETAAVRAAELTRQMLAYSGKGRFVIEAINLNKIVEEMTHLLKASISKNAVLKFNFSATPPIVEADPTQMRQIVMNLITNASDAIAGRSGVITITTGILHADRVYLMNTFLDEELPEGYYGYFEISDTGCGMDEQTRGKIFDPFFTTKFTGRGLGLAATLGIVRGHKGTIKVYSEVNKGSTFKVLLPCTNLPEVAEAAQQHAKLSTWKGSGTILVVDDEETVRAVASMILKRLGFDVVQAENGRVGVEKFRELSSGIEAILLDMTMPQMNGEDAFREFRRIRSDVPVILMSGYNEQDATTQFAGKGLSGFLHKPFKPQELMRLLQQVLGK